jgi:hypothetical protein
MTRVIVHPGFHKTGTSTVQTQLRAARAALAPRWVVGLREDIPDAPAAARAFSASHNPLEIGMFQAALADWLESLDLTGDMGVVISAEGLCGHMPGRPEADNYSAAVPLMAALAEVVDAVFDGTADLQFFFSTRAPEAWLPSLHWQHVRTGELDETVEAFCQRMAPQADLEAIVAEITAAVAPHPVHATRLEDSAPRPQGPITPLLDLMGLSPDERAIFSGQDLRNARPKRADASELADRFAQINAESGDKGIAAQRKQAELKRIWARKDTA